MPFAADNSGMDLQAHVQNGVVVLDEDVTLPEGAAVRVFYPSQPAIRVSPTRKRVQLPLVKTDRPGSIDLTNDRIAEILSEQDAST